MKNLILVLGIMILSTAAHANNFRKFRTCTVPLQEGEWTVYISADNSKAKVSYSGVEEYPVDEMHLGPVASFDFSTGSEDLRLIIAVDEDHEFHAKDQSTGRYKLVGRMTCYR